MKRYFLVCLMTLFGLFQIQNARAELLVEPLVGWSMAQKMSFSGGTDYSGGSGFSYGGRLGYQKLGFQVGLDYLRSSIDMSSNKFSENVSATDWAAFVGFKFPFLIRVYAGYIFSATADSRLNNSHLELNDGTGGKVGLGLTILPFLDINLEYRRGAYGNSKLGGIKSENDVDFEAVMVGVSLPFRF